MLRRYELLASNSRDIILFMDRDDGRILEANEAALRAYGYARAELLALSIRDLRAHPTEEDVDAQMAEADEAGILFQTEHRRKDGSTFPVEVSSRGALVGERRTLVSVVRDISERRRAELALQRSEQRYRLVAENISDVIWVLDLETSRFRFVSPSVKHLRGFTADEVLEHDLAASLTPASAEYLASVLPGRLEEFKAGGHAVYVDEIEQPCKDGTTVWTETTTRFALNAETGHVEVFGDSRDISRRKQAEAALRASEQRLQLHLENTPMAVVEWDAGFIVTRWSGEAERMFGWTEAETLGVPHRRPEHGGRGGRADRRSGRWPVSPMASARTS